MAFRPKEVMSLRERDFRFGRTDNPTPCCQFPHKDADAKGIDCKGDVQVHHILPQMFGAVWLKAVSEEIDHHLNAVSVCENSHVRSGGGLHPDQAQMYQNNEGRFSRELFEKIQAERHTKAERGEPYWNTVFDSRLHAQALHNSREGSTRTWKFGEPTKQFSTVWEKIRTPRPPRRPVQ